MHHDLEKAFEKAVELLKQDKRCKGGWHYGSVGRGNSDVYSDYDPVFLVADVDFESFSKDVPTIMAAVSDKLIIHWPENYNDGHFRNYCNVIRIGENLHQFDFFIMNADKRDSWFCHQHLRDCTGDNIIFDRDGEVGALLDLGLRPQLWPIDTLRAIDTYWFHVMMLIKYFKRQDMFKLLMNIGFLLHAHADLLLSQYDTLDWGGWESKVKHCVPKDKQAHLLIYYTAADYGAIQQAVETGMADFLADGREICAARGLVHPDRVAEVTMEYFSRRMRSGD